MPPINSIEELVDKAINEALNRYDINTFTKTNINIFDKTDITTLKKTELDIEDVKKRKPKPFRYLTKEEMEAELNRTWCDAKGEQAAWMQGRKQIVQAFNEYRKEAPERLATLLHGKAKTSAIKREVKKDAIYG